MPIRQIQTIYIDYQNSFLKLNRLFQNKYLLHVDTFLNTAKSVFEWQLSFYKLATFITLWMANRSNKKFSMLKLIH